MNDYISDLILLYFSKSNGYYSIQELSKILGLPILVIDEYVDIHIRNGDLVYENNVLTLNMNSKKIKKLNLAFNDKDIKEIELVEIEPNIAWPLDKAYFPKKFTKKIR